MLETVYMGRSRTRVIPVKECVAMKGLSLGKRIIVVGVWSVFSAKRIITQKMVVIFWRRKKPTQNACQMLVYCWANVYDVGPTLNQHWADISRSLRTGAYLMPNNHMKRLCQAKNH